MPRQIDVLDVITGMVAVTLGGTAYACSKGHAKQALSTLGAVVASCWLAAPRRRFPTAAAMTSTEVQGKVALVTGVTSGIGVDTAMALYRKGAKVYLVARNSNKLQDTKQQILDASKGMKGVGELLILVCDLSDLASVKKCAAEFLKTNKKLDMLINNAGIMALPERTPTKQGLESQVGVCHVGHFLLTKLLLPAITEAKGRVICLTSSGHTLHKLGDMLAQPADKCLETLPYDPWTAYGNAKACNMLMALGLHRRGTTAFSVMPGGIHTGLQTHVDWWTMFKWTIVTPFFFKSTSQGAATSLLCATQSSVVKDSGKYFDNCAVTDKAESLEEEVGPDAVDKLWTQTEAVLKKLGY